MGININALTLAIAIVAFVGPVESSCPNGWLQHRNSCYLFNDNHRDWDNAMAYCRTHGGYLAEIEDLDESNFLTKECPRHRGPDFWVGGRDETEGTWIWMNSGHHFSFTNWNHDTTHLRTKEPNNYRFNSTYTENCLDLHGYYSYRWNDWFCNTKISFICEKSAQASSAEPLVPPGLG